MISRDEQAEGARDLAGDQFGEQGFDALGGAAELDDVEAVVLGLDDGGDGAAFAQRGDVAGSLERAEHGCFSDVKNDQT